MIEKYASKYLTTYMQTAKLWARASKCPRKKVGCLILTESGMQATGFNGHAVGGPNTWQGDEPNPEVVHAELNALGKMLEQGVSTKGAVVFTTLSPCIHCAKMLVRAGIKAVVYDETYRDTDGLNYLKKYNVKVIEYNKESFNDE